MACTVSPGSRHVLELHGNLACVRCTRCDLIEDRGLNHWTIALRRPSCSHLLRPDIVWFNEMLPPDIWEAAETATGACKSFLVVGTSAVVYPAAGLIDVAQRSGARVIEVNLNRTEASHRVDLGLYGPAGEILRALVDRVTTCDIKIGRSG